MTKDLDHCPPHGIPRPKAVEALEILRSMYDFTDDHTAFLLDVIETALEASGYYEQLERPLH